MRILVLNPPFLPKFSRPQRSPAVTKSGTLYFPIWLASCTGCLEREGFAVDLVDAPAAGRSLEAVVDMVREHRYDLVVMDASTPSILNDLDVAAKVKAVNHECCVVLVGTHVSALAEETLADARAAGVDAVARREYELTIVALAEAMRQRLASEEGSPRKAALATAPSIAGLSYRDAAGSIHHNEDRPFLEDLDTLPWVAPVYRKHLDIHHYFNPNALYPMVTLVTSRGCPFRCSFCVYPQTLTGRRYRFRAVDDVLDEIAWCREHFPEMRAVFFEDDTLTADRERCRELSRKMIDRGLVMSWTANSRADLDRETMALMAQAGCRMLCVGFESGHAQTLSTMRKGNVTPEGMQRFMDDARAAGVLIHGCFIVGFPGEDRERIEATIRLAMALDPDTAQFYPVMVYPGTKAYELYKERGWIATDDYACWLTGEGLHNCVVRNEHFSPEELVRLCDEARRRFYLRPRYMVRKLRQGLADPAELLRLVKAGRTFARHLLLGSRVDSSGKKDARHLDGGGGA